MNTPLALEQAPPIAVPMRFLLSAPLFGMLAAMLLLIGGDEVLATRWSPLLLALTHLVGLGVLSMSMCGALLQMLPVLVGVQIAQVQAFAGVCHGGLVLGSLLLAGGFVSGSGAVFAVAAGVLAVALGGFIVVVGRALWRAERPDASTRGMRLALLGLLATLLLGVALALGHADAGVGLWRGIGTDLHLVVALAGWVAMLVVAVAYQVVPMFQMTAPYPQWLRVWLAPAMAAMLLLAIATSMWRPEWRWFSWLALALLLATFGITTLWLLGHRRRKVGDASLAFWRLGLIALLVAIAVGAASWWFATGVTMQLAVTLFIAGFALSVVCAMLYKIVPFLVWLHLQQRIGANPAARHRIFPPNMKALLPEPRARLHFGLHLAALSVLVAAAFWPLLVRPAAALWFSAFAVLARNLGSVLARYRVECGRIDQC
ncbi:MAG: hypothetical protein IPG63_08400 [Xanthomonadales bacterium]|nr:hypothetical protein [Xanthomonadales bacterium]